MSTYYFDHFFFRIAEFLLKDYSAIQKFMRRLLWHSYQSEVLTVEIIERTKPTSKTSLDDGNISNKGKFPSLSLKFDRERLVIVIY